jgi:hypothetical protein
VSACSCTDEDDVLAIEPLSLGTERTREQRPCQTNLSVAQMIVRRCPLLHLRAEEELRSVGARTGVRHRQDTRTSLEEREEAKKSAIDS